jgi:hypothetical protein
MALMVTEIVWGARAATTPPLMMIRKTTKRNEGSFKDHLWGETIHV